MIIIIPSYNFYESELLADGKYSDDELKMGVMTRAMRQLNITKSIKEGMAKISKSLLPFLILALFFGYQSGGTFITKALNPFGIKWWSLAGALLVGQVAITFFAYLIPKGIYRLVKR